jgi:uncharacterized protein HemX
MQTKYKWILLVTSALALAAFGYYFYEKKRVKEIDSRVDSLEAAIKRLQEAKNN